MKNKILRIIIEHMPDTDPDTSWMGRYSNEPQEWALVRIGEHAGEFVKDLPDDEDLPHQGREFRHFNPCADNYEGCTDDEIRKYCKQDFDRMESLSNGNWCFIGITAKAEVVSAGGTCQEVTSGGLWGIESDAKDHHKEIEQGQLASLRRELLSFGFSRHQISRAMKKVETVNA